MYKHYLFDWGNTLMVDIKGQTGPMYKWDKIRYTAVANLSDFITIMD
jgi:hypothetical protein